LKFAGEDQLLQPGNAGFFQALDFEGPNGILHNCSMFMRSGKTTSQTQYSAEDG
jgi:hypothetical protein